MSPLHLPQLREPCTCGPRYECPVCIAWRFRQTGRGDEMPDLSDSFPPSLPVDARKDTEAALAMTRRQIDLVERRLASLRRIATDVQIRKEVQASDMALRATFSPADRACSAYIALARAIKNRRQGLVKSEAKLRERPLLEQELATHHARYAHLQRQLSQIPRRPRGAHG